MALHSKGAEHDMLLILRIRIRNCLPHIELSFPFTLVAYTRDEKIKGVVILETAGLNYRPTCCLNLRRDLCLYLKHSWGMIDLMRRVCLDHNFLPFG